MAAGRRARAPWVLLAAVVCAVAWSSVCGGAAAADVKDPNEDASRLENFRPGRSTSGESRAWLGKSVARQDEPTIVSPSASPSPSPSTEGESPSPSASPSPSPSASPSSSPSPLPEEGSSSDGMLPTPMPNTVDSSEGFSFLGFSPFWAVLAVLVVVVPLAVVLIRRRRAAPVDYYDDMY